MNMTLSSSSRIRVKSSLVAKKSFLGSFILAVSFMCTSTLPSMASAFAPKQTQTQTPTSFNSKLPYLIDQVSFGNQVSRISKTLLSSTTDDQTQTQQLSAQDRILKEALGIEPETEEERNARIKKRQDKMNQSINEKRKNIAVAILAFTAAILNYAWQFTHPITSLTLLGEMQQNSADLTVIGHNGKPTVVDFWAPWCENCREAAPTLFAIEEEYKGQVNFVMVNGDLGENWPIIERFGVDAIPHLAMVGSDGVVETALIGPIPRGVLRADLDTMLENGKRIADGEVGTKGKMNLPYTMYDAFRSRPDLKQLQF